MTLTFDPRYNIAYIRFGDKDATVTSEQLSDDVILDRAADGTIYGIELLNANEQLQFDDGKFHIVNEATKGHTEVLLPA